MTLDLFEEAACAGIVGALVLGGEVGGRETFEEVEV